MHDPIKSSLQNPLQMSAIRNVSFNERGTLGHQVTGGVAKVIVDRDLVPAIPQNGGHGPPDIPSSPRYQDLQTVPPEALFIC